MQTSKTVVIVGGGIVGLSCAYYARQSGMRVVVIDPQTPERPASYGNAGVLAVCDAMPLATPGCLLRVPAMLFSPSSPLKIRWSYLPELAPWLYRFVRSSSAAKSRAAAVALAALLSHAIAAHRELAGAAGARHLIAQTGWLKAFETRRAYERSASERRALAALGMPMRELTPKEIADFIPGAPKLMSRATLYSACEQVRDPGRYLERIVDTVRRLGVEFVKEEASDFVFHGGQVAAVRTPSRTVFGDYFVLAAGAWSRPLAAQLGATIPLDTERGYHVMLEPSGVSPVSLPVLWSEKSIVLSPMDHGLRITSSVEFAGLQAPPDYTGIDKIVRDVRRAMPALTGPVATRWLGFRPSMPDSLPVIGAVPRHRHCFFAFGHGHLGLTLGPVTGKLIAEQLNGLPLTSDITAFSPLRF